jgi:hypothetical protein
MVTWYEEAEWHHQATGRDTQLHASVVLDRPEPPICAAFELNIRQVVTIHNGHSVGADEVSVPGAVAEFRVRQIGALSSP